MNGLDDIKNEISELKNTVKKEHKETRFIVKIQDIEGYFK